MGAVARKSQKYEKSVVRDPQYLRQDQYANGSNLSACIALHARFSTNPQSWFQWLLDLIDPARFETVMANHMLYHAPDLRRAIAELCRVLRPGGWLFAATNGPTGLREIQELLRQVRGEIEARGHFTVTIDVGVITGRCAVRGSLPFPAPGTRGA